MKLVLALFFLWFSAVAGAAPTIITDHRQAVPVVEALVTKYGAENVLVLYDFDYTTAFPHSYLGSNDWYDSLMNRVQAGQSPMLPQLQTQDDVNALSAAYFLRHRVFLTQTDLPDIIEHVQHTGARVQLFTARFSLVLPAIERFLRETKIDFRDSAVTQNSEDLNRAVSSHFAKPVRFEDGILLTSAQNKGEVLDAFLTEARYSPKAIVLVDDSKQNHVDLEAAFAGRGVEIAGLQYRNPAVNSHYYLTVDQATGDRWFERAAWRIPGYIGCRGPFAQLGRTVAAAAQ